jgi:hypothetical protein
VRGIARWGSCFGLREGTGEGRFRGPQYASVAQLDRASVYGTESRRFESFRMRHEKPRPAGLRGFEGWSRSRGDRIHAVPQDVADQGLINPAAGEVVRRSRRASEPASPGSCRPAGGPAGPSLPGLRSSRTCGLWAPPGRRARPGVRRPRAVRLRWHRRERTGAPRGGADRCALARPHVQPTRTSRRRWRSRPKWRGCGWYAPGRRARRGDVTVVVCHADPSVLVVSSRLLASKYSPSSSCTSTV